jgi:hypothetical protein
MKHSGDDSDTSFTSTSTIEVLEPEEIVSEEKKEEKKKQ